MSSEFLLSVAPAPNLDLIIKRLEELGLTVVSADSAGAIFTRGDEPPGQVAKWGGALELTITDGRFRVVINTHKYREILNQIVQELEQQGVAFSIEEP